MTFLTGASGFIGKNLCNHLYLLGDDYVTVPHDEIVNTDWSQATKVFFLSAYGNMSTHTDSGKILRANVIDLCFVLESLDWSKIESFVFVSTSSVRLRRQTMYSRTKKAAEEILLSYMEKYDAPITIIRPLSVTGRGEQKEHLIPKLIDSCLNGTEMPFVVDATHDFIDIEDLTNGIINLSGNHAKGIFELGTGKSVSNGEVLSLIEKATNLLPNLTVVEKLRDYDNEKWVCENFKARGWGWLPAKSLELSITEMVNDARKHISN
jgi:nucleoside-diphosphate-sugar epimerase